MQKAFRLKFALCALLAFATAHAQDDRHDWFVDLELNARTADETSKFAAATDSGFARIAFVYEGTIRPTLSVNAVVDAVDDGDSHIDITEAFLTWQPVPRSPFRHTIRTGAFYPPLSLENTDADWSSPYTDSFSTINTWIGEELRTIGTEWRVSRALGPRARQREIAFITAAYYGNDPAGALLSWRGWSMHERQTRLNDSITLPVLPQIAPGMMFERQGLTHEPFDETDHRPGYYYGAELSLGRRALLTALHYDNHADPLSLKDGNYGWITRFDHVGAQFELPAELGLIVQWMDGTTAMGPPVPPATEGYLVVDNDYDAFFALLTRRMNRHRVSVRFDDFSVTDNDGVPLDDNTESGRALTAAWRYETDANWSAGLEWSRVEVTRPAYAYAAQPVDRSENMIRFQLRYRLASRSAR